MMSRLTIRGILQGEWMNGVVSVQFIYHERANLSEKKGRKVTGLRCTNYGGWTADDTSTTDKPC
ncbi:hypothetical protein GCM10008986_14830 [Salinibacillus aidingensis]|uniref:Uncharacterized protein n=1 Tax=Salinibacillus aidingensis TaxID=237684 RepID=A0ABN1B4A4_9BACI